VETKPGIGYPVDWENQDKWNGGWVSKNGKLQPKVGGKFRLLAKIFANPDLPEIDDYYEPFTFNYAIIKPSIFNPLTRSPNIFTSN
jgi:nitrate reductase beta subunit